MSLLGFSWALVIGLAVAFPITGTAGDLTVQVESAAGAPVADAVLYALPNGPMQALKHPQYSIDQVNRQFIPRVNVIQTGTSVSFPNSDNIRHSVYSFSPSKVFTLKLYAGRSAEPVVFEKPGLVVLGCNIHDSMVAWLLVVDTPYFARTDVGGTASLTKLPPGDYTLRVWHAPMTEDQQISEPLHVDAAGDNGRHALHILVPVEFSAASAPAQ